MLALPPRSIQYCRCWPVGQVTYLPVGAFVCGLQACTSRSFPLRASRLRPHHHIRTLTSPDHSFSSYLTLLPSASDRSPFTALSPPAFAALATITALPGKLHSLNCVDARPCSPNPYHLRPNPSVTTTTTNSVLPITCRASTSPASIRENIALDCVHRLNRSVSVRVHWCFPASSHAARGPELQRPHAISRPDSARFAFHASLFPLRLSLMCRRTI